jgi:hypothetical protein
VHHFAPAKTERDLHLDLFAKEFDRMVELH